MGSNQSEIVQIFSKTIAIEASASKVWEALTVPELMKKWMLEDELSILTTWELGTTIIIKGEGYWSHFENTGFVLQVEPGKLLQYSHLSSLSRLPDLAENYSQIGFELRPGEGKTTLTLTLNNFPTESIYKHLVFYWTTTLDILKEFIEK